AGRWIRRTMFMGMSSAKTGPGSPGFDVERPDHFAPLLGLLGDELAEVGRGQFKHRAAQFGEPSTQIGIGKARIDLFVELFDDLGGGTLWGTYAVPRAHLIAWDKLTYGGNILCRLGAHRACDSQSAHLTGPDEFDR